MSDQATILHFAKGDDEYIVITYGDDAPPEDFAKPGFHLLGKHLAEIENIHSLPSNYTLMRE